MNQHESTMNQSEKHLDLKKIAPNSGGSTHGSDPPMMIGSRQDLIDTTYTPTWNDSVDG